MRVLSGMVTALAMVIVPLAAAQQGEHPEHAQKLDQLIQQLEQTRDESLKGELSDQQLQRFEGIIQNLRDAKAEEEGAGAKLIPGDQSLQRVERAGEIEGMTMQEVVLRKSTNQDVTAQARHPQGQTNAKMAVPAEQAAQDLRDGRDLRACLNEDPRAHRMNADEIRAALDAGDEVRILIVAPKENAAMLAQAPQNIAAAIKQPQQQEVAAAQRLSEDPQVLSSKSNEEADDEGLIPGLSREELAARFRDQQQFQSEQPEQQAQNQPQQQQSAQPDEQQVTAMEKLRATFEEAEAKPAQRDAAVEPVKQLRQESAQEQNTQNQQQQDSSASGFAAAARQNFEGQHLEGTQQDQGEPAERQSQQQQASAEQQWQQRQSQDEDAVIQRAEQARAELEAIIAAARERQTQQQQQAQQQQGQQQQQFGQQSAQAQSPDQQPATQADELRARLEKLMADEDETAAREQQRRQGQQQARADQPGVPQIGVITESGQSDIAVKFENPQLRQQLNQHQNQRVNLVATINSENGQTVARIESVSPAENN